MRSGGTCRHVTEAAPRGREIVASHRSPFNARLGFGYNSLVLLRKDSFAFDLILKELIPIGAPASPPLAG